MIPIKHPGLEVGGNENIYCLTCCRIFSRVERGYSGNRCVVVGSRYQGVWVVHGVNSRSVSMKQKKGQELFSLFG